MRKIAGGLAITCVLLTGCSSGIPGHVLETKWCETVRHDVGGRPVLITKGPHGNVVSCLNADGTWSQAIVSKGDGRVVTVEEVAGVK